MWLGFSTGCGSIPWCPSDPINDRLFGWLVYVGSDAPLSVVHFLSHGRQSIEVMHFHQAEKLKVQGNEKLKAGPSGLYLGLPAGMPMRSVRLRSKVKIGQLCDLSVMWALTIVPLMGALRATHLSRRMRTHKIILQTYSNATKPQPLQSAMRRKHAQALLWHKAGNAKEALQIYEKALARLPKARPDYLGRPLIWTVARWDGRCRSAILRCWFVVRGCSRVSENIVLRS